MNQLVTSEVSNCCGSFLLEGALVKTICSYCGQHCKTIEPDLQGGNQQADEDEIRQDPDYEHGYGEYLPDDGIPDHFD